MKKYWIIFKNSLQINFTYRFNFFASIFYEGLSLVVFAYIWLSIYRGGGVMGDYTLSGLMFYYVVAVFIRLLISGTDVGWTIGDEIREGGISIYLVAPISYIKMHLAKSLGSIFARLVVFLPIFLYILFFVKKDKFNFLVMFVFFVSLSLGYMINFVIGYLVGISTFYFGFVMGLNFTTQKIVQFFSGMMVPLGLLPLFWQKIASFLPFRFIVYLPNRIIANNTSYLEIGKELMIGLIWLIGLLIFAKLVHKGGLKRFEGEGL